MTLITLDERRRNGYLFSENFVEDVVGRQGEALFMDGEPVGEQHVQVVRRHDVVLALVRRTRQEETENLQGHEPGSLTG